MKFSATTLFCEDIREEKAGTDSLIGVMPDNINMIEVPRTIPKLGMYTRIILYPPFNHKQVTVILLSSDGSDLLRTAIEQPTLDDALSRGKSNNDPFVGIIAKMTASPLQIKETGRFLSQVDVDGVTIDCGQLNIKLAAD